MIRRNPGFALWPAACSTRGRGKHFSGILASVVIIAGCAPTTTTMPGVGAPTTTSASGPTALATPTLPQLLPRVIVSDSKPATEPALQPLVDSITAALVDAHRVPPNVEISQKIDAGNQVIVSWVVNTDPRDIDARDNVRQDAVKILAVVKASGVDHGSVLLAATGAVLQDEKKKVTVVVRAKYTKNLVQSTNWLLVSPDLIFTLCDDKPAIIAPSFA